MQKLLRLSPAYLVLATLPIIIGCSNIELRQGDIESETRSVLCAQIADACDLAVYVESGTYSGAGFWYFHERRGQWVILTANHLIEEDSGNIQVCRGSACTRANLAAFDELYDLAILQVGPTAPNQIVAPTLPANRKHSSNSEKSLYGAVALEEQVYSLGYPVGHDKYEYGMTPKPAVLTGVITENALGSWLKHTAALEPGFSGGPLVRSDGTIVGVNLREIPDVARTVWGARELYVVDEILGIQR